MEINSNDYTRIIFFGHNNLTNTHIVEKLYVYIPFLKIKCYYIITQRAIVYFIQRDIVGVLRIKGKTKRIKERLRKRLSDIGLQRYLSNDKTYLDFSCVFHGKYDLNFSRLLTHLFHWPFLIRWPFQLYWHEFFLLFSSPGTYFYSF